MNSHQETLIENYKNLIEKAFIRVEIGAKMIGFDEGRKVSRYKFEISDKDCERIQDEIEILESFLEESLGNNILETVCDENGNPPKFKRNTLRNKIRAYFDSNILNIEIPNPESWHEGYYNAEIPTILDCFQPSYICPEKLLASVGEKIGGEPLIIDLLEDKNILIAGKVGSGTSWCLFSIMLSLILNYSPKQLRFIIADPECVAFSGFDKIPHMIAPVIYKPSQLLSALDWVIDEIQRRDKLLKKANIQDIDQYNKIQKEEDKLPRIVFLIDELADFMMFFPKEVEFRISRITEISKSTGVHMIVSTQCVRSEVITGILKNSFPTRIAFRVANQEASQTLLDNNVAEKLIGDGDMLYLSNDDEHKTLIRAQGIYVNDIETKHIIKKVSEAVKPYYDKELIERLKDADRGNVCM